MTIHVEPHQVRVIQRRDLTLTLQGLTINDLAIIHHAVDYMLGMTEESPNTRDMFDWGDAWATLYKLAEPMTGSFTAQLPYVDR